MRRGPSCASLVASMSSMSCIAGWVSSTAVCGSGNWAPSITSAHSISSESAVGSHPNLSCATRERNLVQLFAAGSQCLRPLRSARKTASSAGDPNALW